MPPISSFGYISKTGVDLLHLLHLCFISKKVVEQHGDIHRRERRREVPAIAIALQFDTPEQSRRDPLVEDRAGSRFGCRDVLAIRPLDLEPDNFGDEITGPVLRLRVVAPVVVFGWRNGDTIADGVGVCDATGSIASGHSQRVTTRTMSPSTSSLPGPFGMRTPRPTMTISEQ